MKLQARQQIITGTVMVYEQNQDGDVEEVCIQTGSGRRLIPLLTSMGETTKPLVGREITVLCDILGRDHCGNPVIEIKEIRYGHGGKLRAPIHSAPLQIPAQKTIFR